MFIYQFVKLVVKEKENKLSTSHGFLSKSVFQFTLDRSALRLSLENLEKSRTLNFFLLILSLVDFRIQNCEKWSLISEMIFPLATTWSGLLIKMLSIRVAEVERTSVGLLIVGTRKQLWREVKKSYTKMTHILKGQYWNHPWQQYISQRTKVFQ